MHNRISALNQQLPESDAVRRKIALAGFEPQSLHFVSLPASNPVCICRSRYCSRQNSPGWIRTSVSGCLSRTEKPNTSKGRYDWPLHHRATWLRLPVADTSTLLFVGIWKRNFARLCLIVARQAKTDDVVQSMGMSWVVEFTDRFDVVDVRISTDLGFRFPARPTFLLTDRRAAKKPR